MGLSPFDETGEFTSVEAPLPLRRGELVDVLVSAETFAGPVSFCHRAIVAWCERDDDLRSLPTCDLVDFDAGVVGVVAPLSALIMGEMSHGVVALRLPHGVGVWIRLLYGR